MSTTGDLGVGRIASPHSRAALAALRPKGIGSVPVGFRPNVSPLQVSPHLLEAMPIAAYICELDGRIIRYNTRARELWGRDPDERDRFWASAKVFQKDGTLVPRSQIPMALALRDGTSFRDLEAYALRSDGRIIHVVINIDAIRGESGEVIGAISVVQDITTIHETKVLFAALFQQSAIGIVLINSDGSIRDVNPFICKMLGYDRQEMVNRDFRDFGYPDDSVATAAGFALLIQDGNSRLAERRYLRKDGHIVTGRTTAAKTTDPFDRITIIGTIEDVTQERAAQQALAESQAYLKRLSESQLVGITIGDGSGQICEANDTFLRMLGYTRDDLSNKKLNWKTFTAPEHLERNGQAISCMKETGWSPVFEEENIRKDGSRVPVLIGLSATDEPGKVLTWILDISRQKELENQLLQTQKMEAVGQLAGGIAHDFNNLLMIIGSHAELLALNVLPPQTQAKYVGRIQSATDQAAQLTRKLLTFSRKQDLAATDFEVGELMQEAIELVSPSLLKEVEVTFRRGAECWVRADRAQVEQAVVNLVLNASDAMPGGGRIVIDALGVVVSDVEVGLHDTVPAGDYALLKIADTGGGIPPENIQRIFEPFFTTKPKDRGTGLGLAMVYGAVTQTGGHIRVKSSPNMGTTFCVYLPVLGHPPAEQPNKEPCSRKGCPEMGTILVVDDEDAVRSSLRTLLEGCGLAVEVASDATEALQKVETLGESLRVLVTDVVMPGISGTELVHALQRKRAGISVVFMSGYAAGERGHESFERATFLQKPFSLTTLINAVYRAGLCPDANVSKTCRRVSDALTGKMFSNPTPKLSVRGNENRLLI